MVTSIIDELKPEKKAKPEKLLTNKPISEKIGEFKFNRNFQKDKGQLTLKIKKTTKNYEKAVENLERLNKILPYVCFDDETLNTLEKLVKSSPEINLSN